MSKENSKKPLEEQEQEQELSSVEERDGWRKYTQKKWFYPALYLGLAAIILATIMLVQNVLNITEESPEPGLQESAEGMMLEEEGLAIPVTADRNHLGWPVAEGVDVHMIMGFYVANQEHSSTDSDEDVAGNLNIIKYANGYYPHNGIDLARADGEPFDVVAAQAGRVVRAEQDVLAGYVVEIQHNDSLKTVYQSLQNLQVKEGDEVQAGALLGQAGGNLFEKELGNHLHFEVVKDGAFINPEEALSAWWKREKKDEQPEEQEEKRQDELDGELQDVREQEQQEPGQQEENEQPTGQEEPEQREESPNNPASNDQEF